MRRLRRLLRFLQPSPPRPEGAAAAQAAAGAKTRAIVGRDFFDTLEAVARRFPVDAALRIANSINVGMRAREQLAISEAVDPGGQLPAIHRRSRALPSGARGAGDCWRTCRIDRASLGHRPLPILAQRAALSCDMAESHSRPSPSTVLVPAAGDMPSVTQADVERMLAALFEIEGETGDLCVSAAAMIALMARRIHRLVATAAPTTH